MLERREDYETDDSIYAGWCFDIGRGTTAFGAEKISSTMMVQDKEVTQTLYADEWGHKIGACTRSRGYSGLYSGVG